LRFSSGDEDIRRALFDEFEDALFNHFASIEKALFKRVEEWGSEDADDDTESDAEDGDDAKPAKKGLPEKKKRKLLDPKTWERDGRLFDIANQLRDALGRQLFEDHNIFREQVAAWLKSTGTKLSAPDLKVILKAVSWREESAPPVVAKTHKPGKNAKTTVQADPLHGLYAAQVDGKPVLQEFEPDPDLRDTEQVPLLESGGIEAFIRREVLPYTPDAWVKADATKIGYEVSFTRHFYKPQPLRTLEEIRADILAIEEEAGGLLDGLLKGGKS
jgi:type I restriction enzyme M protein